MAETFEPKVVAFLCNWCSYTGADLAGTATITQVTSATVALSVLAHGVTAWWGSNAYADAMERHPEAGAMAEDVPVAEVRPPRRFEQSPG